MPTKTAATQQKKKERRYLHPSSPPSSPSASCTLLLLLRQLLMEPSSSEASRSLSAIIAEADAGQLRTRQQDAALAPIVTAGRDRNAQAPDTADNQDALPSSKRAHREHPQSVKRTVATAAAAAVKQVSKNAGSGRNEARVAPIISRESLSRRPFPQSSPPLSPSPSSRTPSPSPSPSPSPTPPPSRSRSPSPPPSRRGSAVQPITSSRSSKPTRGFITSTRGASPGLFQQHTPKTLMKRKASSSRFASGQRNMSLFRSHLCSKVLETALVLSRTQGGEGVFRIKYTKGSSKFDTAIIDRIHTEKMDIGASVQLADGAGHNTASAETTKRHPLRRGSTRLSTAGKDGAETPRSSGSSSNRSSRAAKSSQPERQGSGLQRQASATKECLLSYRLSRQGSNKSDGMTPLMEMCCAMKFGSSFASTQSKSAAPELADFNFVTASGKPIIDPDSREPITCKDLFDPEFIFLFTVFEAQLKDGATIPPRPSEISSYQKWWQSLELVLQIDPAIAFNQEEVLRLARTSTTPRSIKHTDQYFHRNHAANHGGVSSSSKNPSIHQQPHQRNHRLHQQQQQQSFVMPNYQLAMPFGAPPLPLNASPLDPNPSGFVPMLVSQPSQFIQAHQSQVPYGAVRATDRLASGTLSFPPSRNPSQQNPANMLEATATPLSRSASAVRSTRATDSSVADAGSQQQHPLHLLGLASSHSQQQRPRHRAGREAGTEATSQDDDDAHDDYSKSDEQAALEDDMKTRLPWLCFDANTLPPSITVTKAASTAANTPKTPAVTFIVKQPPTALSEEESANVNGDGDGDENTDEPIVSSSNDGDVSDEGGETRRVRDKAHQKTNGLFSFTDVPLRTATLALKAAMHVAIDTIRRGLVEATPPHKCTPLRPTPSHEHAAVVIVDTVRSQHKAGNSPFAPVPMRSSDCSSGSDRSRSRRKESQVRSMSGKRHTSQSGSQSSAAKRSKTQQGTEAAPSAPEKVPRASSILTSTDNAQPLDGLVYTSPANGAPPSSYLATAGLPLLPPSRNASGMLQQQQPPMRMVSDGLFQLVSSLQPPFQGNSTLSRLATPALLQPPTQQQDLRLPSFSELPNVPLMQQVAYDQGDLPTGTPSSRVPHPTTGTSSSTAGSSSGNSKSKSQSRNRTSEPATSQPHASMRASPLSKKQQDHNRGTSRRPQARAPTEPDADDWSAEESLQRAPANYGMVAMPPSRNFSPAYPAFFSTQDGVPMALFGPPSRTGSMLLPSQPSGYPMAMTPPYNIRSSDFLNQQYQYQMQQQMQQQQQGYGPRSMGDRGDAQTPFSRSGVANDDSSSGNLRVKRKKKKKAAADVVQQGKGARDMGHGGRNDVLDGTSSNDENDDGNGSDGAPAASLGGRKVQSRIWPEEWLRKGTKELNRLIAEERLTQAQAKDLKQARRRMKNRMYAKRSRQKKQGSKPYGQESAQSRAATNQGDGSAADEGHSGNDDSASNAE